MSQTMARDIKLYQELGYELKKVQPVDLFPQNAPRRVCSFAGKSLEHLINRNNEKPWFQGFLYWRGEVS